MNSSNAADTRFWIFSEGSSFVVNLMQIDIQWSRFVVTCHPMTGDRGGCNTDMRRIVVVVFKFFGEIRSELSGYMFPRDE